MKIKSFLSSIALWAILILSFQSCSKQEQVINIIPSQEENVKTKTDYDHSVESLALALNKALSSNTQLRGLIKEEVNLKFDGDYDVLVNSIASKPLSINTKGGASTVTVGDYISSFLPNTKAEDSSSILEELQAQYPLLQIAIPVHAEDWDGSTVPTIAYLPESYNEREDAYIPAINAQGESILLDAVNEPEEPVIVLSQNERIIATPSDPVIDLPTSIDPPQNLSANTQIESIELSWTESASALSYDIYRKQSGEESFVKVGSVSGRDNTTYSDYNLVADSYYHYYVIARGLIKQGGLNAIARSGPSNVAATQSPSLPSPLTHFSVEPNGTGIDFQWSGANTSIGHVNLEYRDAANEMNYNMLAEVNCPTNYYSYVSTIKGRKVSYKASVENAMGESEAVMDYIYPPYRNTATLSSVYVDRIEMDDFRDVEGWPRGKPEFFLSVYKANSNGETICVQNELLFDFDNMTDAQNYTGREVYQWIYNPTYKWYENLTFSLIEGDGEKTEISISASIAIKAADAITVEPTVSVKFPIQNDGERCGNVSMFYFENPNCVKNFPNFNVRMTLSETN